MEEHNPDRRAFLKVAAGCGVFIFLPVEALASPDAAQGGQRAYPDDLNAYLKIGEDGRVTCYSGKIEMGQANTIALAQMVAEELEVPVERVDMVMGDTRLCPWDGGTNGSRSIKYFGPALRAAGAEARETLIILAADHLTLAPASLAARAGFVVDRNNPATRVAYATLVGGKRIEKRLLAKPALKGPRDFTVMGQALPSGDGREKVTGKAVFAGDVRLPGLLHGRVLRPPAHGARLQKVDLAAARAYPGARVFQDGEFVGVVHPTSDGASAALAAIKAEFSSPAVSVTDATILGHLKAQPADSRVRSNSGATSPRVRRWPRSHSKRPTSRRTSLTPRSKRTRRRPRSGRAM